MLTDRMRNECIRLSLAIEQETDPDKKLKLMKKGRALLAAGRNVNRNNAIDKINRLRAGIPKVFKDNPFALIMIEEKQVGYEKFISYLSDLKKGQRITDEIKRVAAQYDIEVTPFGESKKSKQNNTVTRRKKDGKQRNVRTSKTFSKAKFDTLNTINKVIDDKDQPIGLRQSFNKGKRELVKRETEFNGTRRNDNLTNTRLSWNPDGDKLAGSKGAR
ncbi:MAG: hypothetical protein ACRC6V_07755 [Bacteroidales bacterium]